MRNLRSHSWGVVALAHRLDAGGFVGTATALNYVFFDIRRNTTLVGEVRQYGDKGGRRGTRGFEYINATLRSRLVTSAVKPGINDLVEALEECPGERLGDSLDAACVERVLSDFGVKARLSSGSFLPYPLDAEVGEYCGYEPNADELTDCAAAD